jgi:capsular polysaccharide biosynthesis protein
MARIARGWGYQEDPQTGRFIRPVQHWVNTGKVEYLELRNATVYNFPGCHGLFQLEDGRVVVPSAGHFNQNARTLVRQYGDHCYIDPTYEQISEREPQLLAGRYLLPFREADTYYFHFMTETLQSIHDWLRDDSVQMLLPSCKSFFGRMPRDILHQALAALGAEAAPITWLDHGVYRVENLIVRGSWFPGRFDYLEKMLRRLRVPAASANEKIIYISRANAAQRRIANEPALLGAIADVFPSCEVVEPERLNLAAQASLFNSARVVIGPSGGAFTNLLFCRPGTIVVAICPADAGAIWQQVCHLRGLRYFVYFGTHGDRSSDAFEVDPRQIRIALAGVLARWQKLLAKRPAASANGSRQAQETAVQALDDDRPAVTVEMDHS